MKQLISKLFSQRWVSIPIFFFSSSAPLFWYSFSSTVIGNGDYISPLNLASHIYSRQFIYEPYMYNGMELSFLVAHQMPFLIIHSLLYHIGFSPILSSLFFLYIIILIAHFSMFFLVKYILETKVKSSNSKSNKFIAIVAAVLYALSPYNIGIIAPGHILQLIFISFVPAVFLYTDKIFTDREFSIRPFLYLFVLFFFTSSAFANIGIIYVALIFIGIVYVALTVKTAYFIKHIPRFFGVIAVLFLSNIWWLVPFLLGIEKTIAINETSTEINAALESASMHASIPNIFLGRPENMFYLFETTYYTNLIAICLFIILSILMLYSLAYANKYEYIWRLCSVAIIGIFITKALHPPFSELFQFLYHNFPGFQIFRRPVSKFYWEFLFTQILLGSIGLKIFLLTKRQKLLKAGIKIVAIIMCIYLWIAFAQTKPMIHFNIPNYYHDARTYLEKENVNKAVVLPTFSGKQPTFNLQLNSYYGEDFLEYIWKFAVLKPDPTTYSPNLPYKLYLTEFEKNIESGDSFCQNSKNLGVTHIVIRNDVNVLVADKDPQIYIKNLARHKDIINVKSFGSQNQLTIYTLSSQCAGYDNISVSNTGAQQKYQLVSPTKYQISLQHVSAKVTIELLNNFDKSWKIYTTHEKINLENNPNQYPTRNFLLTVPDIQYLWKQPITDKQVITRGFANGWELDISQLSERKVKGIEKNTDGTYNINVVIYYTLQSYSYVGIVIFAASIVILLAWYYVESKRAS